VGCPDPILAGMGRNELVLGCRGYRNGDNCRVG
jgi:hypothetical protein